MPTCMQTRNLQISEFPAQPYGRHPTQPSACHSSAHTVPQAQWQFDVPCGESIALPWLSPASEQCLPAAHTAEYSFRVSRMFETSEGAARTRAPCPPAGRAAGTGPPQSAARLRPPPRHGLQRHCSRRLPLLRAWLVRPACARAAFGRSRAVTASRRESPVSAAHAAAAPGLAGAMPKRWHAVWHCWRDALQLERGWGAGCSNGQAQHVRKAHLRRILHRAVLDLELCSQAAGIVIRSVGGSAVA